MWVSSRIHIWMSCCDRTVMRELNLCTCMQHVIEWMWIMISARNAKLKLIWMKILHRLGRWWNLNLSSCLDTHMFICNLWAPTKNHLCERLAHRKRCELVYISSRWIRDWLLNRVVDGSAIERALSKISFTCYCSSVLKLLVISLTYYRMRCTIRLRVSTEVMGSMISECEIEIPHEWGSHLTHI
jgi:hypothetical protein